MSEIVTISTKRFSDLSLEELYGILRVRSEVFVTGQKCLYVDPDGKDLDSVQVFASEGERIIGCLRIYQKEPGVLQIGRVAVIESQRGRGIGMQMMRQAISYVRDNLTDEKMYLEAQTYAIGFYEKLGFKVISDEFLDEGIPHKGMELLIDRESAEERIETGRLILRPWRESDAESLFRYACDPDVGPRAGWPPHKDIEESRRVIRDIFTNDRTWAVTLRETDEAIGCMGYYIHGESNIAIGENDAEIGYWIAKPYWNRGLATEALRAMVDYCFNVKGFLTLWSDFFIDNPASGRVMEKCGFKDTGQTNWCSHLYHGDDRPVHIMKLEYAIDFGEE